MINFGNLKTLGVLGGMSPAASSFFYNEVIAHTKASRDQDHIDMIILSHATTPDRTKAIIAGKEGELIESLVKDVRTLERSGAENIVVTCNTAHYFYDYMQSAVKVPIINMVRESVRYALERCPDTSKIGIMAADGTLLAGIYDVECENAGVQAVHPSDARQADLMHIIYEEIKTGEHGSKYLFNGVVKELTEEKGCGVVILADTELAVYKKYHAVPDCCLDSMDVLIREAILRSGAKYV